MAECSAERAEVIAGALRATLGSERGRPLAVHYRGAEQRPWDFEAIDTRSGEPSHFISLVSATRQVAEQASAEADHLAEQVGAALAKLRSDRLYVRFDLHKPPRKRERRAVAAMATTAILEGISMTGSRGGDILHTLVRANHRLALPLLERLNRLEAHVMPELSETLCIGSSELDCRWVLPLRDVVIPTYYKKLEKQKKWAHRLHLVIDLVEDCLSNDEVRTLRVALGHIERRFLATYVIKVRTGDQTALIRVQ